MESWLIIAKSLFVMFRDRRWWREQPERVSTVANQYGCTLSSFQLGDASLGQAQPLSTALGVDSSFEALERRPGKFIVVPVPCRETSETC